MDRLTMFVFDYSAGWYLLFGFALALFVIFSHIRKSTKGAARFGVIGLAVGLVSEFIGVGLGLWTYSAGNWPVILWLIYFLFTAAFYQIFCVMNKKKIANKTTLIALQGNKQDTRKN